MKTTRTQNLLAAATRTPVCKAPCGMFRNTLPDYL
jgi:hypothetical protein